MKVIKITPRGFCSGVVFAWKQVLQTIKQYPNSRIFMLGLFVHNKAMVEDCHAHNIIILDDRSTSRYELIKQITVQKNDVLILSAHGTEQQTIELAKEKGFIIIDTTCEYVYKTHEVIKQAIKENKTVIYLGKENHPESLASIAIDPKIIFITKMEQLKQLNHLYDKDVVVTNQTTLSIYDLEQYYEYIKNHFHHYALKNDICLATQQRQEALMLVKEHIEVLIVVGDIRSNNTQQLYKIGSQIRKWQSYLVENLEQLKQISFVNVNTIAVTSGASTPTKITNQIITYLENL